MGRGSDPLIFQRDSAFVRSFCSFVRSQKKARVNEIKSTWWPSGCGRNFRSKHRGDLDGERSDCTRRDSRCRAGGASGSAGPAGSSAGTACRASEARAGAGRHHGAPAPARRRAPQDDPGRDGQGPQAPGRRRQPARLLPRGLWRQLRRRPADLLPGPRRDLEVAPRQRVRYLRRVPVLHAGVRQRQRHGRDRERHVQRVRPGQQPGLSRRLHCRGQRARPRHPLGDQPVLLRLRGRSVPGRWRPRLDRPPVLQARQHRHDRLLLVELVGPRRWTRGHPAQQHHQEPEVERRGVRA